MRLRKRKVLRGMLLVRVLEFSLVFKNQFPASRIFLEEKKKWDEDIKKKKKKSKEERKEIIIKKKESSSEKNNKKFSKYLTNPIF